VGCDSPLAARPCAGKLRLLADWGVAARRCGLTLMWRDTSPQHFNTTGGEWPGGEAPYNCTPHRAPRWAGSAWMYILGLQHSPLCALVFMCMDR